MKITNIFQPFIKAWTYYGYYRKTRRIQSDWSAFVTEWNRIGGFNASSKQLFDLLDKWSLTLVEYATWTPIEIDDQVAKIIRDVLTDYRSIIISLIDWARQGNEPSPEELLQISGKVATIATDVEYGSPMTVLFIITTIFHALQYLKLLQSNKQTDTAPSIEPAPAPKQPIRNLIRKIFNKS